MTASSSIVAIGVASSTTASSASTSATSTASGTTAAATSAGVAIDLLAPAKVEVELTVLEEYWLRLYNSQYSHRRIDRVHLNQRLCVFVQQTNLTERREKKKEKKR